MQFFYEMIATVCYQRLYLKRGRSGKELNWLWIPHPHIFRIKSHNTYSTAHSLNALNPGTSSRHTLEKNIAWCHKVKLLFPETESKKEFDDESSKACTVALKACSMVRWLHGFCFWDTHYNEQKNFSRYNCWPNYQKFQYHSTYNVAL